MRRPLQVIGQKFGRLTVTGDPFMKDKSNRSTAHYPCLCECGKEVEVARTLLLSGIVKSCGCLRLELLQNAGLNNTVHGATKLDRSHKEKCIYKAWENMLQRCFNPKQPCFRNYGGRGIQVCVQWSLDFKFFWRDMEATWKPGLSIDRIDNEGHYNRQNCRWATSSQQAYNSRRSLKRRPRIYPELPIS